MSLTRACTISILNCSTDRFAAALGYRYQLKLLQVTSYICDTHMPFLIFHTAKKASYVEKCELVSTIFTKIHPFALSSMFRFSAVLIFFLINPLLIQVWELKAFRISFTTCGYITKSRNYVEDQIRIIKSLFICHHQCDTSEMKIVLHYEKGLLNSLPLVILKLQRLSGNSSLQKRNSISKDFATHHGEGSFFAVYTISRVTQAVLFSFYFFYNPVSFFEPRV